MKNKLVVSLIFSLILAGNTGLQAKTKVKKVDKCAESRLSMIPECDFPKDLHPCETREGHETGNRFNVNCDKTTNVSKKKIKRNK